MNHWKVAGVFTNPNHIFLNWYNPEYSMKVVFSLDKGSITMYPVARLRVVK